jgi:hypothetical protein
MRTRQRKSVPATLSESANKLRNTNCRGLVTATSISYLGHPEVESRSGDLQSWRRHLVIFFSSPRQMLTYLSTIFWSVTPCKLLTFHRNVLLLSSGSRSKPSSKQKTSPFLLRACYSSTVKMEAVRSSETSVNFYTTSYPRTVHSSY